MEEIRRRDGGSGQRVDNMEQSFLAKKESLPCGKAESAFGSMAVFGKLSGDRRFAAAVVYGRRTMNGTPNRWWLSGAAFGLRRQVRADDSGKVLHRWQNHRYLL